MLSVLLCFLSLIPSIPAEGAERYQYADTIKLSRTDSAGRFVSINRIFIIGNRITRDHIITRELTLKSGDIVFSADLASILETDRRKLINTRLFNTVDIRMLELQPDRVDLLIDLTERWYTFPSPIFELADRNFNEWWQNYDHDLSRVNYGLRLYQFNMRGRNETLRFLAQFGFVRKFELMYRFPYIDKKQKHGMAIEMDFSETKNLPVRTVDHRLEFLEADEILRYNRGVGLTYTYRNSFFVSHIVKLDYRSMTVNDTVLQVTNEYLKNNETSQQYGVVTYQFQSDRRDYVGYPLRGYFLVATATRSGLTPNDDLEKNEVSLSLSNYAPLGNEFYLSNSLNGYYSSPNDLAYANFSALGYRKQFVRGYEVYLIEGPAYFLNKSTFKKRIFSRTYHWKKLGVSQFRHIPISIFLKTYADFGYVKNYNYYKNSESGTYNQSGRLAEKWLSGAGFGLDIVGSYDAVLRLEYSFNVEGENGFFFHLKKEF